MREFQFFSAQQLVERFEASILLLECEKTWGDKKYHLTRNRLIKKEMLERLAPLGTLPYHLGVIGAIEELVIEVDSKEKIPEETIKKLRENHNTLIKDLRESPKEPYFFTPVLFRFFIRCLDFIINLF